MVGDRGMITTARITALKKAGGLGWSTALRGPPDRGGGRRYRSAADEPVRRAELPEITHPDHPAGRLVACRNPALTDPRRPTHPPDG